MKKRTITCAPRTMDIAVQSDGLSNRRNRVGNRVRRYATTKGPDKSLAEAADVVFFPFPFPHLQPVFDAHTQIESDPHNGFIANKYRTRQIYTIMAGQLRRLGRPLFSSFSFVSDVTLQFTSVCSGKCHASLYCCLLLPELHSIFCFTRGSKETKVGKLLFDLVPLRLSRFVDENVYIPIKEQ